MATVIHFNISADDPECAKKFYGELFGWKFNQFSGPMNYHLIETNDLHGNPGIGGGLAKREKEQQPGVINYMGVVSLDESSKKVIEMGGKVIQGKQAVPGWGYMAVCMDTENNIFGLFQEDTNAV